MTPTDHEIEEWVLNTPAIVQYIERWGGACRDCADQDGICPGSGLPCANRERAVRHVLNALTYGLKHRFISAAPTPPAPSLPAGAADPVAGEPRCPPLNLACFAQVGPSAASAGNPATDHVDLSPTTAGSAEGVRLDREQVARIIDPEAWEPFSTAPIFMLAEGRRRSLVKADAILALASPAPTQTGEGQ